MKDELISFKTAKLAKEKGFEIECLHYYKDGKLLEPYLENGSSTDVDFRVDLEDLFENHNYKHLCSNYYTAPTQSLLQRYIRETRGVHIEIHRNASGYYWAMCKHDGGTNLGWSVHCGPNLGGVWDSYEGALEDALFIQLSYDLPKDTKIIKHWSNYVIFAKDSINLKNVK